jgi:DNA primase
MDIKEIKAKLSVTAVLEHYAIKVNRNHQVNCPFHEDKTPSMQVYEDKGLVYCHSSNCKNGGKHLDQIEIIQQKENLLAATSPCFVFLQWTWWYFITIILNLLKNLF